jgi:hypothetical protein
MRQAQWQLQTAKAQLSELISESTYVALKSSAKKEAPDFVAHLLAMPRHKARRSNVVASRTKLALRDIEL